jgi:N-acetylglucosaminyldiphosphoundecaprenol N-acetyl-beta-D-mannosaminyltransferase
MLYSCGMAEKEGYSVFLYGSKPETLEKLKTTLVNRFPRLKIAGTYSPPFRKLDTHEETKIIQMINAASPDILFVGLGVPRQEKWMARHCQTIKVPITIGIGAAFDFISGEKKQAPTWMQARGLEWFFRLLSEPRRLWTRYLIYNPLFVFLFLIQLTGTTLKFRRIIN